MFIERSNIYNLGTGKCSCGQALNFASERDMKMKLRVRRKFCSKPPYGPRQVIIPNKAMTRRE